MLVKHGFNQQIIALTPVEKIINILTETGFLYAPKNVCLIETCALTSNSLFYMDELNCDIFAGSQRSMSVKHGFNETNFALMSVETLNIY